MIIDAHAHIFSSDICRDRTIGFADAEFRLLYESEKSKLIDHSCLMAAMKGSGIDYAIAMGFPWENEVLCKVQNEYMRNVIDLSDGTIIPFGSVPSNPSSGVDEWVQSIREMGLRGIGEVAFYRHGSSASSLKFLEELLAAARKYFLPVCLHVNEPVGHQYPGKYEPNLHDLFAVLSKHPDVTIILSHWGGGLIFYELMPEVSKALSRCYYDTAASPFIYSDAIYRIAPQVGGTKRILFGSDYPLIPYGRYLEAISREYADEELKADVLGRNAARLLKII